ncbi:hypothetical protein MPTK1_1g10700 [Marchantia polymorpha subsp. ruderalis]|uniref:DUF4378 domain-containing protein n=2 Tax=Marchantia polymorpha TaxID=3197 RepID=A0AAF6ANR3_MARPO|nr:hypothetical protein MARPO_0014s0157 [Marchantia polymorpha]BBM98083.1 hypothetical protein Mp_1g10700 [Marchantia polymorpha subsp. ruderalis]|eukprot:PTQ45643.1 hypothetical protein MARPO_0014s0157 [Marchantia polymorpha]
MRSAEIAKQPWVDWVEGRQRQLQLLTSFARMKVEDGMRRPGEFASNTWGHPALPMETRHLTPRFRAGNSQIGKASSCSQQENITVTMRQHCVEPGRTSLLNRDLNKISTDVMETRKVPSCEDLLPHPKSHVNSIQEVISIDVLSTAAKALDFNRNSTTSDGACYPQPACAAILDTPVPSSHYEGKGFRDEIFETGITIFEDDLESHDLDTQRGTAPKAFGPRIVRASGSNHGSGPVVALQGTCRAPELHSEEVSLNQRTMEPDRPTITWLKDTNKFTGLRNPKTYGMTLNELFEGSQSSRGIASNSKYSMGSAEHVTSHHLRNAESAGWKVRRHINWRMHERSDLSSRKREKTRSGLSCHLLGGELDTESHGRPICHRRRKPEVLVADLREKVERNISNDERKHQRTAHKPVVVNLELLWMKVHEDVDNVGHCRLSVPGSPTVEIADECPRVSVESLAEDGSLEESQLSGEADKYKTPQKVAEMQRLADKVLDALLMDVAGELSGICTSVVDNLISREFGDIWE